MVADFNQRIAERARAYPAYDGDQHIPLLMGGDCYFMSSVAWFLNLDRLIEAVNASGGPINAFYSTPSVYAAAAATAHWGLPTSDRDLSRYEDVEGAVWAGALGSRASHRGYYSHAARMLRVSGGLLDRVLPICRRLVPPA